MHTKNILWIWFHLNAIQMISTSISWCLRWMLGQLSQWSLEFACAFCLEYATSPHVKAVMWGSRQEVYLYDLEDPTYSKLQILMYLLLGGSKKFWSHLLIDDQDRMAYWLRKGVSYTIEFVTVFIWKGSTCSRATVNLRILTFTARVS